MKKIIKKTDHPHIVCVEGICGGKPIISGTRTSVRSIAGYYNMNLSIEEILEKLPYLKPAEVHDAISYYFDHKIEIDQDLEENNEEEYWKKICPPEKYGVVKVKYALH